MEERRVCGCRLGKVAERNSGISEGSRLRSDAHLGGEERACSMAARMCVLNAAPSPTCPVAIERSCVGGVGEVEQEGGGGEVLTHSGPMVLEGPPSLV